MRIIIYSEMMSFARSLIDFNPANFYHKTPVSVMQMKCKKNYVKKIVSAGYKA